MSLGELAGLALRMALSLALVLGLLVWLARYAARRGFGGGAATTGYDIEVLARRQLSRSASVQVVRVAGRTFVLGVGDSGVRVLTRGSAAEGEKEAFGPVGSPTGARDVQDATTGIGGGRATYPGEAVRLAGGRQGSLASAKRMLDELLRSDGRHRATRSSRRRR